MQVDRRAQGFHGMGLGWLKSGRTAPAVAGFVRAIEADPRFLDPRLALCETLLEQGRWEELIDWCRRSLAVFTDIPEFHKMLITAVEETGSLDDAFELYDLRPASRGGMTLAPGEIVCCVTARNERRRLPWFLDYYRRLGVDRFFVIDNGSGDDSVDYLSRQADVSLWQSSLPFVRANYGASWFELLLRRYGQGHWCLTVDTDEFLVYEGSPERDLHALRADMERRGEKALAGMLLDMYSEGPIREVVYREGDDPLALCRFFDRKPYHRAYEDSGQYRNQRMLYGGVRQRVFPTACDYMLSKVAFLYYELDRVLASGQHMTNLPADQLAHNRMVLLHFKFISGFEDYARSEAQRGVHAVGGEQYRAYAKRLDEEESISLYHPELSVAYQGFGQLLELGIVDPEPRARASSAGSPRDRT